MVASVVLVVNGLRNLVVVAVNKHCCSLGMLMHFVSYVNNTLQCHIAIAAGYIPCTISAMLIAVH